VFGAPESVDARVHKSPRLSDESSREDSAAALLNDEDMSVTFSFDGHDNREWFEDSGFTVHGNRGMIEVGILPERLRVFLDADRDGYAAGWTEWIRSYFTPPFARTDLNKFSELPELENVSNFRTEMRGWVDSMRTGAPIVAPVSDALTVARIVQACYQSEMNAGANVRIESGEPSAL
jgi:predicted dehydrogenase